MIDNIMNNTYGVLTNRVSVEDILEMYTGEDAMFYGDPFKTTTEDIDEVIGYFENTEEYEKCMELLYIKNDIIADGLTKKLITDALFKSKYRWISVLRALWWMGRRARNA